jgi:hypothetical protein
MWATIVADDGDQREDRSGTTAMGRSAQYDRGVPDR